MKRRPSPAPAPGAVLEVVAGGIDEQGRGVVQLAGGAELLVAGLLPGERARVRIEHRARQSGKLFGRLGQMLAPSPGRRQPRCRHHGRCGGCPLGHAAHALQLRAKAAMLRQRFGIEVGEICALPERAWGYRHSAKRVVGGRAGALVVGSYAPGTHRLAAMDDCLVDHPDLAACAREVARVGSRLGVEPYDEQRQRGDLRYLWLRTDGHGQVLLTLVAGTEQSRAPELGRALRRPTAVTWCVQRGAGNAMRGEAVQQLSGRPALALELCGQRAEIGPQGFLQPNPAMAALAHDALLGDETGELACDLYAGAGITTAALRRRFTTVRVAEAMAESARALGCAPARADALLAALLDQPAGSFIDLIIANPPRAGLGERVCALLGRLRASGRGPAALRVMSCHPAAMARDIARLTAPGGGFRLCRARAYDTLPQTAHLELVVAFAPAASAPPAGHV